jgi:hypothetical protein
MTYTEILATLRAGTPAERRAARSLATCEHNARAAFALINASPVVDARTRSRARELERRARRACDRIDAIDASTDRTPDIGWACEYAHGSMGEIGFAFALLNYHGTGTL